MRKRTFIKLIVTLLFGGIFLFIGAKVIYMLGHFAGSYAYAKYYSIYDISNKQLVNLIIELKKENPQYETFLPCSKNTIDKIDDNGFYGASFYIQRKNIIIYCVINLNEGAINNGDASIGLDMILSSYGTKEAKFIKINDIPKKERKEVISIFETEILNNLGKWKSVW